MKNVCIKCAASVLSLLMILSFSACGKTVEQAADTAANAVSTAGRALGQLLEGDVTGEIGKDYRTEWFSFNVASVEEVSEYAGYTPAEGYTLVDVVVSETNIFESAIPMGTFDFYMDSDSFMDYIFPLDPLDDSMMPLEFELAPDESVQYHMVYEIPVERDGLALMYTEIDEDEVEHATFTIKLNL
jgi:hypothetical protein